MAQNKARQYLENHILTAPKEQLLLMLFDGAIRFAEQGKTKIDGKDFEESCKLLIKAQRIMIELLTSLDREKMPEDIYLNLSNLYTFVYFRLVRGNINKDNALIDEGLRILRHLRETWSQAVEQARKEMFPEAALVEKAESSDKPPPPPPPRSFQV